MNILLSLQEACQLGKITSMNVSLTLSLLCPSLHFYFHIIATRANAGSCSVFIYLFFFLQRFISVTYEYVKHACRLKSVTQRRHVMHFAVLQLLPVCHISSAAELVSSNHMAHLCADLERVLFRLWPHLVIYLPLYLFIYLFI